MGRASPWASAREGKAAGQGAAGAASGAGRAGEPGVQGEALAGSPIVLPGPARTPSGHPSHPTVGVGAALPTPWSHLGTKQSLAWRLCLGLSESERINK